MSVERAVPVVLSVLIIVAVAVVQEHSRQLAALLATMPLTAPLAMWIVWSASGGDARQTRDFVATMIVGHVAGVLFVLACWATLRLGWPLPLVLVAGGVVWLGLVVVVTLAGRR